MKKITAVDLLRLVHPNPAEFVVLGAIFRGKGKDPHQGEFFTRPSGKRWKKGVPIFFWLQRQEITKYLSVLKKLNGAGHNIYYSLAGFDGVKEKNKQGKMIYRRTKKHVSSVQSVFLDFDEETPASRAFEEGKKWGEWPAANVVIKTSPGHSQCIWLLKNKLKGNDELQKLEFMLQKETRRLGADPAASDCTRVFRLPGYGNANRSMFSVTAILHLEKRYSLDDFPVPEKTSKEVVSLGLKSEASSRSFPSCSSVIGSNLSGEVILKNLDEEAKKRFPDKSLSKIGSGACKEAIRRWEQAFEKHKDKEIADWAVTHYFLFLEISEKEIWKWLVKNRQGRHADHLEETIRNAVEQKNKKLDQCGHTDPKIWS